LRNIVLFLFCKEKISATVPGVQSMTGITMPVRESSAWIGSQEREADRLQ
jgi:hypothetical protein